MVEKTYEVLCVHKALQQPALLTTLLATLCSADCTGDSYIFSALHHTLFKILF